MWILIWIEAEAPAQGRGVVLRPGPEPGPFFNGVVVVGNKPTLRATADPRCGIGWPSLGQFISQTQWTSVIDERLQKRRAIGAGVMLEACFQHNARAKKKRPLGRLFLTH